MKGVGVELEDEVGRRRVMEGGHVGRQATAEKVVPIQPFIHPGRRKMNEHLHVIAAPLRRVRTLNRRREGVGRGGGRGGREVEGGREGSGSGGEGGREGEGVRE